MILVNLFDVLFVCGVSLVIIFNIVLVYLYCDGLQCVCFLLVIVFLEKYCYVVEMVFLCDWCLCVLSQVLVYFMLFGVEVECVLVCIFVSQVQDELVDGGMIIFNGCDVLLCCCVEGVLWFIFDVLCEGLWVVVDYIVLVKFLVMIFVFNVLQFIVYSEDVVKCFVQLVDEFYDCCIKLVLLVVVLIIEFYDGECLCVEFGCIELWLIEMQSEEYFVVLYWFEQCL